MCYYGKSKATSLGFSAVIRRVGGAGNWQENNNASLDTYRTHMYLYDMHIGPSEMVQRE